MTVNLGIPRVFSIDPRSRRRRGSRNRFVPPPLPLQIVSPLQTRSAMLILSRLRMIAGLVAAGFLIGLTGCPNSREAKIPEKTFELPKEGPKAAGAEGAGKGNQPGKSKAVD